MSIDVTDRLHVTSCAACGVVFALSEWLYLQRAKDGGTIACPNGHSNAAAPVDDDLSASKIELLAELRNVRHLLALAEVKTAAPADPPDEPELRRRCRALSETAKPAVDGGRICQFCGSRIGTPPLLRAHIWRKHRDKLAGVKI